MAESRRLYIPNDETLAPVLGVENIEQISYTPIRCRIDANVTVTGETGNTYTFNGGGAVVEVASADVPKLLGMRLGGALCCGDATFNVMFEKA